MIINVPVLAIQEIYQYSMKSKTNQILIYSKYILNGKAFPLLTILQYPTAIVLTTYVEIHKV